jgi:hypothetical protein
MAMASFFLSGCGQRPDSDVTSSPEYSFSRFAGTVWKTKVKVAVADVKRYNGWREAALFPPDGFDPTHPKYQPPLRLQQWGAVLPVGTRVRIERLMKDNGRWGGVSVTASLEDGTVVYLDGSFLAPTSAAPDFKESIYKSWGVNPDLLEKAD